MSIAKLACPAFVSLVTALIACTAESSPTAPQHRVVAQREGTADARAARLPNGRLIFGHWTFGDEPFWIDTLHLNQVIETGVSPATALAVGLKVDAERLPPGFLASADLTTPATTVELLRRDAVVGVEARVTADNH